MEKFSQKSAMTLIGNANEISFSVASKDKDQEETDGPRIRLDNRDKTEYFI